MPVVSANFLRKNKPTYENLNCHGFSRVFRAWSVWTPNLPPPTQIKISCATKCAVFQFSSLKLPGFLRPHQFCPLAQKGDEQIIFCRVQNLMLGTKSFEHNSFALKSFQPSSSGSLKLNLIQQAKV